MTLKPLGKVKELVESVGMGISHAYDDLVFLDHNAFLLQFGENSQRIIVHTNSEASTKEAKEGISRLRKAASLSDLDIVGGGFYTMSQAEDEIISIEFHEAGLLNLPTP